ncbi:Protein transport protein S9 plasma membrane t-SNARE, variant 2 [Orbilia oligospora]|nr:Protein transport protein S9 plasma membrane t-SNARE [Orbilia oligospora]KAF3195317.1 Protein transport protein S9 plasma membrane t-SNARE [Orbilia oligospora]KAF3195318.1 Protein transport protein S9 plasma membrane t-SNARE, variant 2 [Orbilia oligospora]KAF3267633.1 Protein transport protein S9 plasma membrane t-SNARE [Orbilia oligospora]KAF3269161.1 Protein transport protein S9 plasma membrane t-SNARE [Orbilia oligospora]
MGWFSKKEKVATPDTASSNPYAAPPPAYDSGSSNAPSASYDNKSANLYGGAKESSTYGNNPYGAGNNPYGAAKESSGDSYGASMYGSNNKAKPSGGSNPYGGNNSTPGGQDDNPYSGKGSYGYGSSGYSAESGYDSKDPYSTGQGRQMTAEEEEEEDADALKAQIRFTKQESVASTRNALRAAARAEEVGRDTLVKLGEQGEKLHQTELNLDMAKNHGHRAEDQAAHLKRLNRSMFVPVAGSPFGRQAKADKEEEKIMERHRVAREERERVQAAGMQGQQQVKSGLRPMGAPAMAPRQKMSLADKAKYQFEADAEDDAMEEEIDDNLHQLGGAIGRLNLLAKTQNQVVQDQNKTIDRLNSKSESVHQQIDRNTHRINKIK